VPDLAVKPPSTKEEASQSKKTKPPNFSQEFVTNLKLILANLPYLTALDLGDMMLGYKAVFDLI
jgi:hypothetical protein